MVWWGLPASVPWFLFSYGMAGGGGAGSWGIIGMRHQLFEESIFIMISYFISPGFSLLWTIVLMISVPRREGRFHDVILSTFGFPVFLGL